ncbi:MAG: DUF488 family protein [bacterium]|nr:MAG: DUF488 family protein [bacterium]
MLREASVSELRKGNIPKANRVLVNRGRGNDELSPSDALYGDFNSAKERLEQQLGRGSAAAHNEAFLQCDYERRFREEVQRNPEAMARLEELARRSDTEDVYLICYEGPQKACHRRILLRLAEEFLRARVAVDGVEPS